MATDSVFIAGMDKCGTTALSEWMIANALAEDRVPGEKEPALYVTDDLHPGKLRLAGNVPLLDATVAYSKNAEYIARLPEHNTKIVICWRNQFERSWSLYKMLKLFGKKSGPIDDYFLSPLVNRNAAPGNADSAAAPDRIKRRTFFETVQPYFPRRLHGVFKDYVEKEMEHIFTHNFFERVQYELSFYLSRRQWPFASVLAGGFFYLPVRLFLEKYQPADVAVISVNQLDSPEQRRRFVREIFERDVDTPKVPVSFSSENIELDEPKPDFHDRKFDMLRDCFRYDLEQARELVARTRFGKSLLDHAGLDRYLASAQ
jgi:hypothetical protein